MANANLIVAENLRPGTDDWQLMHPATSREIEGYASATRVNRGDAIELIVAPIEVAGTAQIMPTMDPDTGLVDCAWVKSITLTTRNPSEPNDWLSGIYLARLSATDSGAQSYVIFVVRDDQRKAALLFQLSVTTYQAYNYWGGKSLYHWGSM